MFKRLLLSHILSVVKLVTGSVCNKLRGLVLTWAETADESEEERFPVHVAVQSR